MREAEEENEGLEVGGGVFWGLWGGLGGCRVDLFVISNWAPLSCERKVNSSLTAATTI